MAVAIPETYDYGTPTPRGERGVVPYKVMDAPVESTAPANAASIAAQNIATVGRDQATLGHEQAAAYKAIAADVDTYGRQIDTTMAQDALNKLRSKRVDMTVGDDGFLKVRGGDALKRGEDGQTIYETFPQRFSGQIEAIGGTLLSPRARTLFNNAAAAELNGYKTDVAKHGLSESEKYQGAVYKETAAQAQTEAAQSFDDPAKLEIIATRAESAAQKRARSLGLPGDSAGAAARSDVYRIGLETLLASGNSRQALTYYDSVKGKLDGPDLKALTVKMKSTATEVEAEGVVNSYGGLPIPGGVKQWDPLIQQAATDNGIRPALGVGLISQESAGNPQAISPAGARGLTQLMPGTARDLGVKDPHAAEEAIPAGFKYLRQQLDKYQGNERLALMAYNWGPGNVDNWVKAGADPEKVPAETRDYVQKVQGYAASYTGRVDTKASQIDILSRTDLPAPVKAAAYTMIEKRRSAFEAMKVAQVKQLDDTLEATTQSMIVSPGSYKKGLLSQLADSYESAGDMSKAVNTRILAAMENQLLDFATSSSGAQNRILEGLLPGKAKALASGILAGDEKGRTEAGKFARNEFAGLQSAVASGVNIETLAPKIGVLGDLAAKSGDPLLMREIHDYVDGQAKAHAVAGQPPVALSQAIADFKTRIEAGDQANATIKTLQFAEEIQRKQKAEFERDAFTAGTSIYPNIGAPVPLNLADNPTNVAATLSIRALQARQVRANSGHDAIPFTEPEIAGIRAKLDQAPPDQQGAIMATLALAPPDMLPGIAHALAGKKDISDPLSRSYAAALSFYADKDSAVADQILRGARIAKDMGEAGKKAPVSSDAWQSTLQDRMGNVFQDMGSKVPAIVADAVASVYTYQMHRVGRQGEKVDTDVLDKAITAVVGSTVSRNGQAFLPPVRGMDRYDVDKTMRTLTDGDTAGLKTLEGDPITADVVYRRGVLTNVGEGLYKVRIPDPRRGGDLSEVQNPETGRAWVLDMKPLVERSRVAPSVSPNAPDYVQAPSLSGRRPEVP